MKFQEIIIAWWTPAKQSILEAGMWAAALGFLAGTLRIIAQRMPVRTAVQTITMGVIIAVLVGWATHSIEAVKPFKDAIIAVSAIAAKEWVEFFIRAIGRLRDKSDKVADKLIDKIPGESKEESKEVKP
jgi:hypothetical protein